MNQKITIDEISESISFMKRGKSPGIDRIIGEFFTDAKPFILFYTCRIYNCIFDTGLHIDI